MNFYGMYAAAKIGGTTGIAFTNGVSNRTALMSAGWRPTLFVLRATKDVYIRQGDVTITATTTDTLLRAGTYFPLCVESAADAYIATYGAGADGTLYCTLASRVGSP